MSSGAQHESVNMRGSKQDLVLAGEECTRVYCLLDADQPGIVFIDLGGGFYQGGNITHEFKQALREHELRAFHGDDASVQPGHSGDFWPHETAVSWVRERLRLTLPTEPLAETEEDFEGRLKAAATWVNAQRDVDGSCRQMPQRMHDLVHVVRGGRLDK